MEPWLDFAKGPAFRLALAVMVLGLGRHAALTLVEAARVRRAAADRALPWGRLARRTLAWLFPVGKLGTYPFYGITTLAFHAGAVAVPLLLAGHVALWQRATGLSWPALPGLAADGLTLAVLAGAPLLVLGRAARRESRRSSRAGDYALPLLVALPFAAGFLTAHPGLNPFPFGPTYLVHILSGEMLMILIPFTRLSHLVLMPPAQVVAELGWRLPAGGGAAVAAALGKEDSPP